MGLNPPERVVVQLYIDSACSEQVVTVAGAREVEIPEHARTYCSTFRWLYPVGLYTL